MPANLILKGGFMNSAKISKSCIRKPVEETYIEITEELKNKIRDVGSIKIPGHTLTWDVYGNVILCPDYSRIWDTIELGLGTVIVIDPNGNIKHMSKSLFEEEYEY